MVTLGNAEPNTWSEHELQECDLDKETDTCVGDDDRPNIAPTNYLHVSKRDIPIDGQFILDLSLSPPPPPPGISSGKDRKNLTLHTTNAPVTAEIWITHDGSTKPKRVSLDLSSSNGIIRAIVHDPFCPDKTSGRASSRPFFDMALRANYGDVFLSLPHCFRGPITIRITDERIAFSPALGEYASLISDVPGVRVYFVGARPRSGKWGNGNGGSGDGESVDDILDELTIDGRFLSVRINWDGEDEVPIMKPNDWQVFCGGAERFFTTGRVC